MKRIVNDLRVMASKPIIRDTRITVDMILELLASGMKPEEIVEDYNIGLDDIKTALLYAAKILGREEVIIETRA